MDPSSKPKSGKGGKQKKGSVLDSIVTTATQLLDRSNDKVRVTQDFMLNAGFFVGAIYLIHNYGHKLAV